MDEQIKIMTVENKVPSPEKVLDFNEIFEKAKVNAAKAVLLAEENKPVYVPHEPTLLERIEKLFSNGKTDKTTTSVGLSAAAIAYYESFEAFASGNSFLGWIKLGQGTFALAIGIISKDPIL